MTTLTTELKTTSELQKTMADHYKNNEIGDIIFKTTKVMEFLLTIGMPTLKITYKIMDLGVKHNELGLSMALALKRTDDKYLSTLDRQIKLITIQNHSKMIKELEGLLV